MQKDFGAPEALVLGAGKQGRLWAERLRARGVDACVCGKSGRDGAPTFEAVRASGRAWKLAVVAVSPEAERRRVLSWLLSSGACEACVLEKPGTTDARLLALACADPRFAVFVDEACLPERMVPRVPGEIRVEIPEEDRGEHALAAVEHALGPLMGKGLAGRMADVRIVPRAAPAGASGADLWYRLGEGEDALSFARGTWSRGAETFRGGFDGAADACLRLLGAPRANAAFKADYLALRTYLLRHDGPWNRA